MDVYGTILKRRTIRKFRQDKIPSILFKKLVNAARLAPSGANKQPWHFSVISESEKCDTIFPYLKWAGYITPHGTPKKGEEPTSYIVISINEKEAVTPQCDASAAAMNIILTATELGIGTCWIGAIDKKGLIENITLPKEYTLYYVIAMGYSAESPRISEYEGSVKYYKDDSDTLVVPKKSLSDIVSGV